MRSTAIEAESGTNAVLANEFSAAASRSASLAFKVGSSQRESIGVDRKVGAIGGMASRSDRRSQFAFGFFDRQEIRQSEQYVRRFVVRRHCRVDPCGRKVRLRSRLSIFDLRHPSGATKFVPHRRLEAAGASKDARRFTRYGHRSERRGADGCDQRKTLARTAGSLGRDAERFGSTRKIHYSCPLLTGVAPQSAHVASIG